MAIALKNGVTASNASATTTLVTGSMGAVAVGDYVLVALAIASGSITVTSVTDLAGNTYARRASTVNASGVRTELWNTVATGANANNTVTLTPSSSVLMAMCVESYTGPTALGNTETATGTDRFPNASLVFQDPYNWNVGALGFVNVSGDTGTQKQGTIERGVVPALTSVGCYLMGATQPGPGTVPVMLQISASRACGPLPG
jgi:hypothetical protein